MTSYKHSVSAVLVVALVPQAAALLGCRDLVKCYFAKCTECTIPNPFASKFSGYFFIARNDLAQFKITPPQPNFKSKVNSFFAPTVTTRRELAQIAQVDSATPWLGFLSARMAD